MRIEKYHYYVDRAKEDFPELIKEIQNQLDASTSKGEDYYILNYFWGIFMDKAMEKWYYPSDFFMDDESMMPMPDSVFKQFVCMIFKIKHLSPLYDLPIDTSFNDYEFYEGHPYKDEYSESYSRDYVINYYNTEMFADSEDEE